MRPMVISSAPSTLNESHACVLADTQNWGWTPLLSPSSCSVAAAKEQKAGAAWTAHSRKAYMHQQPRRAPRMAGGRRPTPSANTKQDTHMTCWRLSLLSVQCVLRVYTLSGQWSDQVRPARVQGGLLPSHLVSR